jgi:hypothetical protein
MPAQEFSGNTQSDVQLADNSSPQPTHSISRAAHDALSTPWAGSMDFRYADDDSLEDENDSSSRAVRPEPTPSPTEPGSSDTDSEVDKSDVESSRSEAGEFPDIFETEADLNTAEYSKYPHHASHSNGW